ncbi:MAG: hypothetical protein P9L96_02575 [Candidatus Gygaella obscura]|nr:hypothetical protein [Candidatus Gygaella obscura]
MKRKIIKHRLIRIMAIMMSIIFLSLNLCFALHIEKANIWFDKVDFWDAGGRPLVVAVAKLCLGQIPVIGPFIGLPVNEGLQLVVPHTMENIAIITGMDEKEKAHFVGKSGDVVEVMTTGYSTINSYQAALDQGLSASGALTVACGTTTAQKVIENNVRNPFLGNFLSFTGGLAVRHAFAGGFGGYKFDNKPTSGFKGALKGFTYGMKSSLIPIAGSAVSSGFAYIADKNGVDPAVTNILSQVTYGATNLGLKTAFNIKNNRQFNIKNIEGIPVMLSKEGSSAIDAGLRVGYSVNKSY